LAPTRVDRRERTAPAAMTIEAIQVPDSVDARSDLYALGAVA
jgi:hypothetical protein